MSPSGMDSSCLASIVSEAAVSFSSCRRRTRRTPPSNDDRHQQRPPSSPTRATTVVPLRASTYSSGALELAPGAVGGFCSVVVGHPLDLIKVRMQASSASAPSDARMPAAAASPSTSPPGASPPPSRVGPLAPSTAIRLGPVAAESCLLSPAARARMPISPSDPRWGQRWHPPGQWGLPSRVPSSAATTATVMSSSSTLTRHSLPWVLRPSALVAPGPLFAAMAPSGSRAVAAMAPSGGAAAGVGGMLRDLARHGGIRTLYAGVSAPLLASVPAFGLTVSTFELAKKLQHDQSQQFAPSLPDRQHERRLSVGAAALAGAASGIPAALVLGPLERIKCRFQLHPGRYRSLLECAREAHRTHSPHRHDRRGSPFRRPSSLWIRVREVFRGTGLTVLRDVPGNAVYFAVYESARRQLLARLSSSTSSTSPCSDRPGTPGRLQAAAAAALAGGTAGVANWCLCLPVDAVKTRWQTAPPGLYASPRDAARAIVAEGGGRASALFRGLRPALLRAFPANAAALCGVEVTRQVLGLA